MNKLLEVVHLGLLDLSHRAREMSRDAKDQEPPRPILQLKQDAHKALFAVSCTVLMVSRRMELVPADEQNRDVFTLVIGKAAELVERIAGDAAKGK
jgi:hypothetical protein